jgi:hypothetical protein
MTMLAVYDRWLGENACSIAIIWWVAYVRWLACLLLGYVGRLDIHSEWLCLLVGFYAGNAGLLCCVSMVTVLAGNE